MLAEAIVRIGRPLARSSMTVTERIRQLTDVYRKGSGFF